MDSKTIYGNLQKLTSICNPERGSVRICQDCISFVDNECKNEQAIVTVSTHDAVVCTACTGLVRTPAAWEAMTKAQTAAPVQAFWKVLVVAVLLTILSVLSFIGLVLLYN